MDGDLFTVMVSAEHVVHRYDCHILADIFCWNGILIAGKADEAVFLYPAKIDFIYDILADLILLSLSGQREPRLLCREPLR